MGDRLNKQLPRSGTPAVFSETPLPASRQAKNPASNNKDAEESKSWTLDKQWRTTITRAKTQDTSPSATVRHRK
jgi:hypothetical protein